MQASGGLEPFTIGLYGCSEMLNEGFKQLVDSGVIRRKVHDDLGLMQRLADGTADAADAARLADEGEFLHGAFYLGSPAFYAWLRALDPQLRGAIGMRRISEINQLYGGNEALERLQRRDARFFNSCMMATALGAAVSDGLEDGRVVSGVGGQYNFVAMAHALPQARSVLMLRATRASGKDAASNVRWNYGHTTIPRHLRDLYITEYGIADLRHKTDQDCVLEMAGICDARFQTALLAQARQSRKLRDVPEQAARAQRNTPQALEAALAPFRRDGSLPDYPLGSDFTDTEQRLLPALGWLKSATTGKTAALATLMRALLSRAAGDAACLQRMDLATPRSLGDRVQAKLLAYALQQTRQQ